MTASLPTRAQLERSLTQRIQSLYQERLGQRSGKVTCQFFDEKLAIVLENSAIPSEQFLLANERQELAERVRLELDKAIAPAIKSLIEEVIGVPVITLLVNSDLEHRFSAIVVLIQNVPAVRDPASIPKVKREQMADSGSE